MLALTLGLTLLVEFQDAQEVLDSGVSKAKNGDLEGAYQDFSKAIELKPDFAAAFVNRARVSLQRNKPDAALADLDRAIELVPAAGVPYYLRGRARLELLQDRPAAADLTRSLELGHRTPEVYKTRARCRDRLGDYAGAVQDYDQALALSPSDSAAIKGRGYSRLMTSDVRGSLIDLTDAIELNPKQGGAHLIRGWAYVCLESWENALRDFRKALEAAPEDPLISALGVWIARSRLGQRDAATEELKLLLRTLPENPLAAPFGQFAHYLAGRRSEAELVEQHPVRGHFWIAARKSAEGDAEGALASLRKATSAPDVEGLTARHALRSRQAADRRRTVEALEVKARTLKNFHAEFELLCPDHEGESKDTSFDPKKLMVDADLEASRVLLRIIGTEGPAEKTVTFLFEGGTMTMWGPPAYRVDLAEFFKQVDGMFDALFKDLDRLVPPESPRAPESPPGFCLVLTINPRPSKDEQGTFRVAAGWATRPYSWLSAVASSEGPDAERDGTLLTFDLPAEKRKIAIDEATGFLAGMEVTDYDGKVRRLARRRFVARADFPDLVVPAQTLRWPIPFEQLQSYLEEQHAAFGMRLAEVFRQWDRIVKEDKLDEARKLAAAWAARRLDVWHTQMIRSAARQHLKAKLDAGATPDELLKSTEGEREAFGKQLESHRKELQAHLAAALARLRTQVRAELISLPIDSRRHGTLKTFLNEALDFERVEKERSKGDVEKIDKLFREELEAMRRL